MGQKTENFAHKSRRNMSIRVKQSLTELLEFLYTYHGNPQPLFLGVMTHILRASNLNFSMGFGVQGAQLKFDVENDAKGRRSFLLDGNSSELWEVGTQNYLLHLRKDLRPTKFNEEIPKMMPYLKLEIHLPRPIIF